MSEIRIALVGLGLIGKERARALAALRARARPVALVAVLDPFSAGAGELARANGAHLATNLDEVFEQKPDLVVICTPNDVAVDTAGRCLSRSLRVLVEKPLGRSAAEARRLVEVAPPGGLHVGFNYRFQPGIARLVSDARAGTFGEIVSVKAVLGHGGEPGLTQSWKLDKERIGGGCLLDPGIHVLDLCRLLAKREPEVKAVLGWSGFWKKDLEEECHVLLDGGGFAMNLDLSIVRWRSTFELEVHGTEGYGIVTGRNRSYGPQRYVRGERWGWRGGKGQRDSETLVVETNGDESFVEELDAILFPGAGSLGDPCDAPEALKAMELFDRCAAALAGTR